MKKTILTFVALTVCTGHLFAEKTETLVSPDGNVKLEVTVGQQLTLSAFLGTEQILKDCPLSLQVGKEQFGTNPKLSGSKRTKVDEVIKPVVPLKYAEVPNKANQLTLTFKGGISVDFRAYDNGVAYRFSINKGNKIVDVVNEGFVKYVSKLKPNKAVLELYNEILLDIQGERVRNNYAQADKLEAEVASLEERVNRVNDLYFDGKLSTADRDKNIARYMEQIERLKYQIGSLRMSADLKMREKLTYSINLISNLGKFFQSATCKVKIKLLGSIFPEKLLFDGKKYRTHSYNGMLNLIYKETKHLQGNKKESDSKNRSQTHLGCDVGLEPTTPRTTIWCSTN